MGASLVAQALQHWSHASDRAFRVLVKMALTAKDKATEDVPANLYFAGHDVLAMVLDFPESTKQESRLRAVRLAVTELEEMGAVRCTREAYSGGNATYELTLNAIPKPRTVKPRKSRNFPIQADAPSPPQADAPSPPQADAPSPPQADAPSPPLYKEEETLEEPLEELKEDEGVGVHTDLTVTRATAAARTPETDSSACRDPTCEMGYVYDPTRPKGQRNIRCPSCNPAKPKPGNVIPFPRKESA